MEHNILLNASYCYSIKSKFKSTLQCSNKPKTGSNLCGKHINCKNIIYYGNGNNNSELLNNNFVIETFLDDPPGGISNVTDIISNIINNIHDINDNLDLDLNKTELIEDKKIYEKDELYDRIINNISTCIYSIRKSIKHCKKY